MIEEIERAIEEMMKLKQELELVHDGLLENDYCGAARWLIVDINRIDDEIKKLRIDLKVSKRRAKKC